MDDALLTQDQYLNKNISPLVQRVLKFHPDHGSKLDDKEQEVFKGMLAAFGFDFEDLITLSMIRRRLNTRGVDVAMLRLSTKPLPLANVMTVGSTDNAELDRLRQMLSEREAELMKFKTIVSPPPPSSMPPLKTLDNKFNMNRASLQLIKVLMEMTQDSEAEDEAVNKQERVGEAKFAVQAWYDYRRASKDLPELSGPQRQAAELMDAIYLSFMEHNVGRKKVQDEINRWWKTIYPGAKVALQGSNDPTIRKISWNAKPPP